MASSSSEYLQLNYRASHSKNENTNVCSGLKVLFSCFCYDKGSENLVEDDDWKPFGSPVRKRILVEIRKITKQLLLLLYRANSNIEKNASLWFQTLSDNPHSEIETNYSEEIDWYNNNRRQILKGLKTILEAYEKTLNTEYSDLLLEEEVLMVVEDIRRDMKVWERTRTEQYAMELQLKRAFSAHMKPKHKGKHVVYDTDYTDFSNGE